MFSVGGNPFHILFGVNRSSDTVIHHPNEGISAEPEQINLVAYRLDIPLYGMMI